MDIKLKGHINRRQRVFPVWLKMKKYYDEGKSVSWIAFKLRKENGEPYSRQYIYHVFKKLKDL